MNKATVYSICDLAGNTCYIGSSKDFSRRKIQHISQSHNEKDPHYHTDLYKKIRMGGGWSQYKFHRLQEVPYRGADSLHALEQTWIDKHRAGLVNMKGANLKQSIKDKRT